MTRDKLSQKQQENNSQPSTTHFLKKWWALLILFVGALVILFRVLETPMSLFVTFCDFSERIGFNWCSPTVDEDEDEVELANVAELAHHLFSNKRPASLEVKIQPTPPLIVGKKIHLYFTNNSNRHGYFLAFSIDSEGQLFSFVPKSLKLPEIQRYLQIDKGQTLIIPQPNVPEDPFWGIKVDETVGQALLVVILIDELTLELVDVLLPEPGISASTVLTRLHEKLIKPVSDAVSGTSFWSSLVMEYETVSSTIKED